MKLSVSFTKTLKRLTSCWICSVQLNLVHKLVWAKSLIETLHVKGWINSFGTILALSIWFRTYKVCTWLCRGNFFQKCGKIQVVVWSFTNTGGPQKVVTKYCQNILTPYLIFFFYLLAYSKLNLLQKLHPSPVPHILHNYFHPGNI